MNTSSKRYALQWLKILLMFGACIGSLNVYSKTLPAPLMAALLVKVASFERQTSSKQNIVIQVINDDHLAKQLQTYIGQSIGQGKIIEIVSRSQAITETTDIVFVGRTSRLIDLLAETRKKNILTFTGHKTLAYEGVIVGLFDNEGVPGILLNLISSRESGLRWETDILDFVTLIE
ncbi:YfiR family protein [Teredinibacter haidensis]|uniref:YfiR family protein n=1 Tax=Teredinibacter haidensis TaxID=2731755 RepID=UPI000948F746|nr:YfiR family protein [Teredinibacter haidensis]